MAIDPALPVPVADFRVQFPAFADVGTFPNVMVDFYLQLAFKQLPYARWGDMLPLGEMLWTAHFLSLDYADSKAAASGKGPGSISGLVTSKSVGSVSVGYDMTTASEEGAGHWNQTTYGRRFIRFARMAGTGPIQISGPLNKPGTIVRP